MIPDHEMISDFQNFEFLGKKHTFSQKKLEIFQNASPPWFLIGIASSVSYTHLPSPRDATLSRMPSSA